MRLIGLESDRLLIGLGRALVLLLFFGDEHGFECVLIDLRCVDSIDLIRMKRLIFPFRDEFVGQE